MSDKIEEIVGLVLTSAIFIYRDRYRDRDRDRDRN